TLTPGPPDSPRDLGPDRAGDESEQSEDHADGDRRVALEIRSLIAFPEEPERFPGRPPEAGVRRQGDGDMDVEDPLARPLIRVLRGPEQRKAEPGDEQHRRGERKDDRAAIP